MADCPLLLASPDLTPAERNCGITDLEGLVVIYALQVFRPYLLARTFELTTDHSALRVFEEKNPTSARLRRWALILLEFDLKVTYMSGANHADVDCFSRHLASEEIDSYSDNCIYAVAMPLYPEEWAEEYDDT